MARIVIAAYGSRGDIAPVAGVGCRLRDTGHDVVMTTTPDLADELARCGLVTRTVDYEPDQEIDTATVDPMKAARELVSPKGMYKLGANLLAALDDVPADVLLLTPFAELAGHPLAEARSIPSIGIRLQPISTTRAFPPSLLGGWSAGSLLNRSAGRLAASAFDRLYGKTVARFRDQLGLPRRSASALRRDRTRSDWPILHGFSPSVVARPDDWRPGLEVVGYWWPPQTPGWQPPPELVGFLENGSQPVYFGLGSLMTTHAETQRLSEIVSRAFDSLGIRGVVAGGGAGLEAVSGNVVTIDTVPHEWLFERVSAVVHSCGAGTMAAGLRAGVPAVAVPSPGGDQLFWARRLHELGVSSSTIPRPKLDARGLARAIDAALSDERHRTSAQDLREQIAAEDGAGRVVTAVEQLVHT